MRLRLASLCLVLSVSGCFSPSYENGKSLCGPAGECPEGFSCAPDNHCYTSGTGPDLSVVEDLSAPDLSAPDLTVPDMTLVCSSGQKLCNGVCVSATDNTVCNGACNPGFHLCGSTCAADSDVNTCGTHCTPCVPPAGSSGAVACVPAPDGGVPDDGGINDYVCKAPTCNDGVKDGNETDVDCGGSCQPCADGKGCLVPADCTSKVCNTTSHTCSAPTCTDGIKNGLETDVDCGGPSCAPCALALHCNVAADCASNYCPAGTCAQKAQGAVCGGGNECMTGNCVDSVCCDKAASSCSGCKACNVAGSVGTCTNVPMGQDPHSTCTLNVATCQLAKCAGDGTCNAPMGTSCGASTCTSGTETDPVCASGGTCTMPTKMCAPFSCGATTCNTMCNTTTNAGCDSTHYCVGGTSCASQLVDGSACTADFQCVNGHCTQGQSGKICSALTCPQACSVMNASGTACVAATSGTDPKGNCPAANPATCQKGSCNGSTGATACTVPMGTSCGTNSCSGSTLTTPVCNSSGVCTMPSAPCANNLACASSTTCNTSCGANSAAGDANCATGFWCNGVSGGACVAPQSQGNTCNRGSQCSTPACVDGFCCSSTCNGGCQACSSARTGMTNGTCANVTAGQAGNGCGAFLCSGGTSCPTTCAADTDCTSTAYCKAGTPNTCQPQIASTMACSTTNCVTLNCRQCSGSVTCPVTNTCP